jgi:hypothetical protein
MSLQEPALAAAAVLVGEGDGDRDVAAVQRKEGGFLVLLLGLARGVTGELGKRRGAGAERGKGVGGAEREAAMEARDEEECRDQGGRRAYMWAHEVVVLSISSGSSIWRCIANIHDGHRKIAHSGSCKRACKYPQRYQAWK